MKREHLIATRKKLGKTQEDVASFAGIHRSYYGLIETGKRNPNLNIAKKLLWLSIRILNNYFQMTFFLPISVTN